MTKKLPNKGSTTQSDWEAEVWKSRKERRKENCSKDR